MAGVSIVNWFHLGFRQKTARLRSEIIYRTVTLVTVGVSQVDI
jgi:hypothetical protein